MAARRQPGAARDDSPDDSTLRGRWTPDFGRSETMGLRERESPSFGSGMRAGKQRVFGALKATGRPGDSPGGRNTAQPASHFGIHTSRVTAWKKQPMGQAAELVANRWQRRPTSIPEVMYRLRRVTPVSFRSPASICPPVRGFWGRTVASRTRPGPTFTPRAADSVRLNGRTQGDPEGDRQSLGPSRKRPPDARRARRPAATRQLRGDHAGRSGDRFLRSSTGPRRSLARIRGDRHRVGMPGHGRRWLTGSGVVAHG